MAPPKWRRLGIIISQERAKAAPSSAGCMLLCRNHGTLSPQDALPNRCHFGHGHLRHALLQDASVVAMDSVKNTGQYRSADTNDIIVLDPQGVPDVIMHATWNGSYCIQSKWLRGLIGLVRKQCRPDGRPDATNSRMHLKIDI